MIDVHSHAFPETVIDLVSADSAFGIKVSKGEVTGGPLTDHALFASLHEGAAKVAELDEKRLEGAIVSLAPRLFAYHLDLDLGERMADAANRGLAEYCAYDPARLRWMAQVPLQEPARAAQVLADARAAGAVGAAIGTSVGPVPLDEAGLDPFWAAAEELGTPIFVHPAYNPAVPALERFYLGNAIGNPLATTICAERLVCAGVLDRHPGLRFVLAHAGGYFAFQAGRLRHARTVRAELADAPEDPYAYTGRLIFDTITHDREALAFLVSRVGADNVVIGSDFPYDMATPDPVGQLAEAVGAETAERIGGANPARLYGA
jgi:aminocarboxymuconate-semialdehyde decarboxylase